MPKQTRDLAFAARLWGLLHLRDDADEVDRYVADRIAASRED
jgi:hypothetical protein